MSTRITLENFTDYPKGTKVEFNFGAYYPICEGVITGVRFSQESRYLSASARLTAEYFDHGAGEMKYIEITTLNDPNIDKGIGTYLIDIASYPEKSTKSPWSNFE